LHSVVRPYPAKVAGVLLRTSYEVQTGEFSISWAIKEVKASSPSLSYIDSPPLTILETLSCRETEIFVPSLITRGRRLVLEGVSEELWRYDESRQTLFVLNPSDEELEIVSIRVQLDPPLSPRWSVERSMKPYFYCAFIVTLIGILYIQFWSKTVQ
jgi:Glycoside hydrolase family 5 C-terminal domain